MNYSVKDWQIYDNFIFYFRKVSGNEFIDVPRGAIFNRKKDHSVFISKTNKVTQTISIQIFDGLSLVTYLNTFLYRLFFSLLLTYALRNVYVSVCCLSIL